MPNPAASPLALSPQDIQPIAGAAPPPTPTPEAAPEEASGGGNGLVSHPAAMLETLPADLLDNPLIFSIAKGQPAAVSAPDKSKDPMVLAVMKHAQPLVAAGFGIYHSHDKKNWVLFNTQALHAGDLEQADQQGRLEEIAPPFNTLNAPGAPSIAGATPSGGAGAAPMAMGSPPAASVQNKLASLRGKNLSPTSPTGGAAPGAGQILNSILKPVV